MKRTTIIGAWTLVITLLGGGTAGCQSDHTSPLTSAALPTPTPSCPLATPTVVPNPALPNALYALVQNYHCAACHSPSGLANFQDLSNPQACYSNLVNQPATVTTGIRVVPFNPGGSVLILRLKGLGMDQMPLDGPPYMTPGEIQLFEDWICQGANPQ